MRVECYIRVMDSTTAIETLRQYFEDRADPSVFSAYLFGSLAQGTAHSDSDVDVGVLLDRNVMPTRAQRSDARVRLTSDIIGVLHRNDVDLVILNDVPPGLGRQVITEGISVFVADLEGDRAFQRDIQLRAADLDPFLRRMRKIKLEALSA